MAEKDPYHSLFYRSLNSRESIAIIPPSISLRVMTWTLSSHALLPGFYQNAKPLYRILKIQPRLNSRSYRKRRDMRLESCVLYGHNFVVFFA